MSDTERDKFLEQLYELYFDRLVRFCRWYLRAYPDLYYMAEECVQDVFYRATKEYRNLLDHPDGFSVVAKIAYSTCSRLTSAI